MKRIILLLAIILVIIPIVVLASGVDVSKLSNDQLSALSSEIAVEKQKRIEKSDGYIASDKIKNIFIGLKGYELQQIDGKNIIIILYDFAHYDERPRSAHGITRIIPYQDGVELDRLFSVPHKSDKNRNKNIKKGAIIEIAEAFILASKSPVEVALDSWDRHDGIPVEGIITLP